MMRLRNTGVKFLIKTISAKNQLITIMLLAVTKVVSPDNIILFSENLVLSAYNMVLFSDSIVLTVENMA
jgi:hypothetical protein